MNTLTERNLKMTKMALLTTLSDTAKIYDVGGTKNRITRQGVAKVCAKVISKLYPPVKEYADDFREMKKIADYLVGFIDEKLKEIKGES